MNDNYLNARPMRVDQTTAPILEPIVSETREPKRRRQSGIYQILCKPTGKVYVGSAVWLAKRKRHHKEALLAGNHHSRYLQRAWDKYGMDAFVHVVLEYCDKKKLTDREQHYIDLFRSADFRYGFNLQPRAHSNLGMVMSPGARAKISAMRKVKGGTLSLTQINELRERMKGNTFSVGLKHTPEARAKMKKARKGRTPALGMHHAKEARKKISEAHKGIALSKEHREKISQAHKGKKLTAEHNWNVHVAQSKIKPDQFEKVRTEYVPGVVTMKDLAARYGCCAQTICDVVNGKRMVHP